MAILFHIYWSESPGVTKATGTKIEGVTSPYEHTGLENGVPYYYVVTAYDTETGLESDESAEVSGTPLAQEDVTSRVIAPRTPVALVVLSMDFCGRTFGVDPCLAAGTPCFNTFPTCKYQSAFQNLGKDYRFTSADAPVPFDGVRPYVKSVKLLPTEIKGSLTVSGRVTVEMLDEPDTDIGIDPYVTGRSYFPAIPGTFWKKWLSRNRNFRGRFLKVYQGWLGETEEEFELRWVGKIETAAYDRGVIRIEAADLLKDLSRVEVPPKLDVKLAAGMTAEQTGLTVTDASGLDAPSGTLRIDDEVVSYASIDTDTGVVTGVTRGVFGTGAQEHAESAKVQKVKVYPRANMFDRMKAMLTDDGGIATGYVDTAAFDDARDQTPAEDVHVDAVIAEPTKLDKLYFELVELAGAKSWVGEHNKVTIARDLPNHPDRTLFPFSDADNIIHGSAKLDRNEKSRLTRAFLYWDQSPLGKDGEVASYGRLDVAIDADAESANEYGDVIEKKVYCRWLHSAGQVEEEVRQFAANAAMRMVWRNRNASPVVTADAEIKDDGIKTGDWLLLSTDEILDIYGFAIAGVQFQVVKRDHKGNKVTLVLLRGGTDRIGFIAPDGTPDWDEASDSDKKYGFIADDDGLLPGGERGYHIY